MRKWKCIKSYASREWLTKDKIYIEDNGKFKYDDGWVSHGWNYDTSKFNDDDSMSNYLEAFEEIKPTQKYDLKKEKVAVLCDTKDKIREMYKIYKGHPSEDIFKCYNPSRLYIAWDDNEKELTWDSLDGYFEQNDYKLITFEEFKGEDEMKFKVGDKVKVIDDNWGVGLKGKIGTVVDVDNIKSESGIGVVDVDNIKSESGIGIEFENFKSGHECRGHAKSRQGWYYQVENIELVSSTNNQKSIHITFSDNSTHAVLKDGKDIIKQSTVGLYHGDEYKFEVGVMEVVKKLLDIKDDTEECECECEEEIKFDWDSFKNDKVAVIVHSEEEAKLFINGCYEHGLKWTGSSKNETYWTMNSKGMLGYSFSYGTLGHCNVEYYKYNGFKLVGYKSTLDSENLSKYSVDELLSEIKLRMEK